MIHKVSTPSPSTPPLLSSQWRAGGNFLINKHSSLAGKRKKRRRRWLLYPPPLCDYIRRCAASAVLRVITLSAVGDFSLSYSPSLSALGSSSSRIRADIRTFRLIFLPEGVGTRDGQSGADERRRAWRARFFFFSGLINEGFWSVRVISEVRGVLSIECHSWKVYD